MGTKKTFTPSTPGQTWTITNSYHNGNINIVCGSMTQIAVTTTLISGINPVTKTYSTGWYPASTITVSAISGKKTLSASNTGTNVDMGGTAFKKEIAYYLKSLDSRKYHKFISICGPEILTSSKKAIGLQKNLLLLELAKFIICIFKLI